MRTHGGVFGRAVRPGDIGTVEGIRTKDDQPVVQWSNGKTRLATDDALERIDPNSVDPQR